MTTFADLGVSDAVVSALRDRSITEPFPIQAATIEAALDGRDICGKAPTGSGKTLAFGVPIVDLVAKGKNWRPKALILAPTRELATQIKEELAPLAKANDRSILTVFGGTNIERDIRKLERGIDILVACPGRLEDLIARRCCELRDVELVVVDEADRMADMGFLPSVKRLLDQTSDNRHTLLFSATLDGDVDMLIKRYQHDPLTFEIEEQVSDIGDVEHSWHLVPPNDRISSAVNILKRYESSIVFCRTRRGCDRVAKNFKAKGLPAVAIHGDRSQSQRERALNDFATGKAAVLVATDVAARGIHVDNVSLVMHYDPAGSDKDYIHRSGRTGRAGQDGRVISMVVDDKKKIARQLMKDLGQKPGFDDLDLDALPPVVKRVKVKPEHVDGPRRPSKNTSKPQNKGTKGNKGDRAKDRGRGEKSGQERNDRGKANRKKRNDRDGRDGRDGRDRSDRSRRANERGSDRDDRRADGKRKKPRRRPGSNDWYPPGYHDDDEKRKDRTTQGRRTNNKRTSEDDRPAGGSGTKKRKSRSTKGRHADKSSTKNKGKRRNPKRR